jgi:hypothetical protein
MAPSCLAQPTSKQRRASSPFLPVLEVSPLRHPAKHHITPNDDTRTSSVLSLMKLQGLLWLFFCYGFIASSTLPMHLNVHDAAPLPSR